nr:hypothetical protein [uncultured Pedobacter sp.]
MNIAVDKLSEIIDTLPKQSGSFLFPDGRIYRVPVIEPAVLTDPNIIAPDQEIRPRHLIFKWSRDKQEWTLDINSF